MPYYETCPDCGANLDPGEKCDCGQNESFEKKNFYELLPEAHTVAKPDRNERNFCYKKGPVCEATQNETEDFIPLKSLSNYSINRSEGQGSIMLKGQRL